MAEEKQNNQAHTKEREFMPESTENIVLGAQVFAEKASEIFNTFIGKVKETAGAAYDKGTEIYEQVSVSAQNYMEKYRDRSEMASLKESREKVASQLGEMCFMEFAGRYRFRVEFMKSEEFRELIGQMRELDKKIIEVGERLEERS